MGDEQIVQEELDVQETDEQEQEKYDILKMYYNEDYVVVDGLSIHMPTIGDIIEFGESKFWSIAGLLCANPTSLRMDLWHSGIDWTEIDDFTLFIMLLPSFNIEKTKLLFGDFDLTKLEPIMIEDKIVLIHKDNPLIQIDEKAYERMVEYLRIILDIHPKVENIQGQNGKELVIWEEENKLEIAKMQNKDEVWKPSVLFPMISAALNHPGFKYKKNELKEVGLMEFFDSVKRLQIYESVTSFMTGMYMGMLDTSKLDMNKEMNWMRDIYKD